MQATVVLLLLAASPLTFAVSLGVTSETEVEEGNKAWAGLVENVLEDVIQFVKHVVDESLQPSEYDFLL